MKLYLHPVSTTCRPIMLFAMDEGLALEQEVVDILSGAQYQSPYCDINPNGFVPVLEDGDFRLTESSAILKYLADTTGSAAYPTDPRARARVHEAMDWFNTNLYRTFGYGLCYAQLLDAYRLDDATGQSQALEKAQVAARRFLGILDTHMLGSRPWLCGETITIADYFASGILSLGEVIGCDFDAWPNVARWYAAMKARPNWDAANGALAYWTDAARGPDYVTV